MSCSRTRGSFTCPPRRPSGRSSPGASGGHSFPAASCAGVGAPASLLSKPWARGGKGPRGKANPRRRARPPRGRVRWPWPREAAPQTEDVQLQQRARPSRVFTQLHGEPVCVGAGAGRRRSRAARGPQQLDSRAGAPGACGLGGEGVQASGAREE